MDVSGRPAIHELDTDDIELFLDNRVVLKSDIWKVHM